MKPRPPNYAVSWMARGIIPAEAGVRPNLLYGPRDGQRDDLKLIGGVAAKYEQKLNALGIFHFDQIAAWTEKDITWFKSHLGEFDERVAKEKWIEQAAKLATGWRPERDAGDAPKSAARPKAKKEPKDGPERLKSPRKGKADDLKLIWGVADELEKKLQALGIWHFEQIAKWTDIDEKWMTEKLGDATNRIGRDNWVAQAKKLAGGWRPASGIGERPQ